MNEKHGPDDGFGVYALIIVIFVLIIGLGAYFADTFSSSTTQASELKKRSQLVTDATLIQQRIVSCAFAYPSSDGGGAFANYPAEPPSDLVSDLECPGTSASLWSGSDGVFYPPAPRGYSEWTYSHTSSGIHIQTAGPAADSTLLSEIVAELGSQALQPTSGTLRIIVRGS
jgi:hypothetical protein